jgi:hypothetical protein
VSVAKIGRSAGTATAGIFHVSGRAETAASDRQWSTVVKILGDAETRQEKKDTVAAERELAVYRSGAFSSTEARVRSPQCYAIQEWNDLHFIWQEDLSAAPQAPWIPEYFVQSARHFGHFNAHWPEAALPDWEWLSQGGISEKYYSPDYQKRLERIPDFQAHSLARRTITMDVAQELRQLGQESDEIFSKVLETPKGVCHGDCHPKNLFPILDSGAGSHTVAIDWAHVGIESLGSDIGLLLGSPVKWIELSPSEAGMLVDPVFDAYVTGLTEAGWKGNVEQVRLTYLACLVGEAIRMTWVMSVPVDHPESHATFERLWKLPIEQIFDGWREAFRFFLAYREEALHLARGL